MNAILQLDHSLTFWFERGPHWLHPYFWFVTLFGSVASVVAIAMVLAIVAYRRKSFRWTGALLVVLPAELLVGGIKLVVHRARPDTAYARAMLVHSDSFPSGHSFGSAVLYGLLAYWAYKSLARPWNIEVASLLGLLVLLVGISRLYLGAHWVLDVLAGWAFGAAAVWLIVRWFKLGRSQ